MGLVLTKGSYTKNSSTGVESFTETSATWFFENPYWNKDDYLDFALKVTNTETKTVVLKAFSFSFLVANSGGRTFLSSDSSQHTASGNGCSMTCSIVHNGVTASATKQIPASGDNIQYSESPGQSYFTPRPGPSYVFKLDKAISIAPNDVAYVRFKTVFSTDRSGENCIQISSYDSAYAIPTYKVVFDANGGEGGNTQYIVDGDDATPPEVTRENYEFTGWTPNSGWTNVQSDLTFTANWKIKGVIWVRENGVWIKKLYPRIFDASTNSWISGTVHRKDNSGWSDM